MVIRIYSKKAMFKNKKVRPLFSNRTFGKVLLKSTTLPLAIAPEFSALLRRLPFPDQIPRLHPHHKGTDNPAPELRPRQLPEHLPGPVFSILRSGPELRFCGRQP